MCVRKRQAHTLFYTHSALGISHGFSGISWPRRVVFSPPWFSADAACVHRLRHPWSSGILHTSLSFSL